MEEKVKNTKILKTADRLIISVDVSTKQQLVSLCHRINNRVSTLKIGLEMIYSCGPGIVETAKSFGYKVMLDAKLMDIPNTVNQSIAAITKLGVDKITIHCLGGAKMLFEAKAKALSEANALKTFPPLLFGVTILTSLDNSDLVSLGFKEDFVQSVMGLADLAVNNNIDGIICSPNEVSAIRQSLGYDFYIATPGIRLPMDDLQDQKRSSTPFYAIKNGADFIIVGRSVTAKENIDEPVNIIFEEIERALN